MVNYGIRLLIRQALVAQLDRAPDFESGSRRFESVRAHQVVKGLGVFL